MIGYKLNRFHDIESGIDNYHNSNKHQCYSSRSKFIRADRKVHRKCSYTKRANEYDIKFVTSVDIDDFVTHFRLCSEFR